MSDKGQDTVTLRQRCYQLLEIDNRGLGYLINILLMALILLTVVVVIVESVPTINKTYKSQFLWFEYLSITIFSLEYIVRIWGAAEINPSRPWLSRWQYAKSPMALIDFFAIAPFYLGLFIQIDTRFLRVIRLLRVLKLTRYSSSLSTLVQVLKNEMPSIVSALSIMLVLIIFASAGIYLVEREAQPEAFGSIPQAMWWATITLTTVGYGDVVPITVTGRVLGILITIMGVGIAALPAGIIASGFSSELHRRREEYRVEISKALADGELSHQEMKELSKLRSELGLSAKESKNMLRLSSAKQNQTLISCPHCGEELISDKH